MSISKFNQPRFDYGIPANHEYAKLSELDHDKTHIVHALYINTKGNFGDAPVAVTDTNLVNLPQHLLTAVNKILEDKRAVQLINDGKVGFTIDTYENQYGKQYTAKFVDIK